MSQAQANTNVFANTFTKNPTEVAQAMNPPNNHYRYILLNPLEPEHFSLSFEEMVEALDEFGIEVISSGVNDVDGPRKVYFAMAKNMEALKQMVNTVDLDGVIVRSDAFYDQLVQETVEVKH